ncbi:hypothetical protein QQ020_26620 [Fulvivirgaceae bacterium BMA12]|uniref:Uncharacterized protein n=1 Tax=Agaribacillus aureus TaxID=3051825 RepID=A0ABT8LD26_9BACT|nr:hypothetical protein [Fulvivirgaceae bacterium BMA12]
MKNTGSHLVYVALIVTILMPTSGFAQFEPGTNLDQIYTLKKVGINTDAPTTPLEIRTIGNFSGDFLKLRPKSSSSYGLTLKAVSDVNLVKYIFDLKNLSIDYPNIMVFDRGKVGIGTALPESDLHISSGNDGDAILTLSADEDNNNESDNPLIQLRQDGGALGVNIGYDETNFGANLFGIGRRQTSVDHWDTFIINTTNGNVGIGTKTTSSYKLSVNGNIRAKEVKVETGWSDFVFEDDYELITLAELEAFIKANKHLPEIPSAEEVAENGVSLGEMDSKLLQKIEELTLYIIDQQKEIEILKEKAENKFR